MTPEIQRIAIAETCGWSFDFTQKPAVWVGPKGEMFAHGQFPPDYLNDLNACAEMEKHVPDLTDAQMIYDVCNPGGPLIADFDSNRESVYGWSNATFATAAQRCEAFLRVKGLWK